MAPEKTLDAAVALREPGRVACKQVLELRLLRSQWAPLALAPAAVLARVVSLNDIY